MKGQTSALKELAHEGLLGCLGAAERHALHVQDLVHAVAVGDSMTFGERDPEKGKSRSIVRLRFAGSGHFACRPPEAPPPDIFFAWQGPGSRLYPPWAAGAWSLKLETQPGQGNLALEFFRRLAGQRKLSRKPHGVSFRAHFRSTGPRHLGGRPHMFERDRLRRDQLVSQIQFPSFARTGLASRRAGWLCDCGGAASPARTGLAS